MNTIFPGYISGSVSHSLLNRPNLDGRKIPPAESVAVSLCFPVFTMIIYHHLVNSCQEKNLPFETILV